MDRPGNPTSCETARQRISASLDGELRAAAAADLEAHLIGCAACRAERDEMRNDIALLSGALPTLSRNLTERVLRSLPEQAAPAARGGPRVTSVWRPRRMVATVAALVLFGLALLLLFPTATGPNGEDGSQGNVAGARKIGELEGRYLFVIRTDGERKVLSEWTEVHEGDTFENDDPIPARLTLDVGAELALAEDTKLQVDMDVPGSGTVVHMIGEGSLFASLDAQEVPFVVAGEFLGAPVRVRALGTVFHVNIERDRMQVQVFEGVVEVETTEGGREVTSRVRGGEGWINGEISTEALELPGWPRLAMPSLEAFDNPEPAPPPAGAGAPRPPANPPGAVPGDGGDVDQPLGNSDEEAPDEPGLDEDD